MVHSIEHISIFLMVICMAFCDQSLHRMIRLLQYQQKVLVFDYLSVKIIFLLKSFEEGCATSSMNLIAFQDIFKTNAITRICNFKRVLYKKLSGA